MSSQPDRTFSYATAIGPETGIARRDPSNVIRVDGTYYVWYARVTGDDDWYPHSYGGTIWYATSPDGHEWTEQGQALPAGETNTWDEYGVLTPNIIEADETYYLFYTGVPAPFSNDFETATPGAIGVARADSPDGPWSRTDGNPVLEPAARDSGEWDDFRIDDACPILRDGQCWLYYKGVNGGDKWRAPTPMCLATADDPVGPYRRADENPLVWPGHEVTVWPLNGGVTALVNDVGLFFAPDGSGFEWGTLLTNTPKPPGVHVDPKSGDVQWGLCHRHVMGTEEVDKFITVDEVDRFMQTGEYYDRAHTVYLERFDCDLSVG